VNDALHNCENPPLPEPAVAVRWWETAVQDLRASATVLRRSPGFSAAVVLLFALGLGGSIGFFATLNDVFWRQPPGVRDPGSLVVLRCSLDGKESGFSHLGYLAYRDQTRSFAHLLGWRGAAAVLRGEGAPEKLEVQLVTDNFFAALGVRLVRGRDFLPEEHRTPGTNPVAIVSHQFWQRRFAGDPGLVGRTVQLDKTAFTVVGIAPPGFGSLEFDLDRPPDVWLPLMMEGQVRAAFPTLNNDTWQSLKVLGRLRPGVGRAQAEAELAVVAARIERPDDAGRADQIVLHANLWCYDPEDRAKVVQILGLLNGIVALVLVIVCANVANLFLARAAGRRREIAVRLVLGAGRARLVRQLAGEVVLLALLAAVPALLLAWGVAGWFWSLTGLPVTTAGLDLRLVAYTAGLALTAGLGCGLVPAWLATRRELAADLKAGAGHTLPSRSRLRTALLLAQIAAALVLLQGAGLFVRTVQKLAAVDFGFPVDHLLVVRPDLSLADYPEERTQAFYRQLVERVATLPGVVSVTRTAALPQASHDFWGTRAVVAEGGKSSEAVDSEYNEVAPDYFATLGVPLTRGREFSARDTAAAPAVVIVNEALARRLWPGEDPLGRQVRIRWRGLLGRPYEVVGVARDLRVFFREDRPPPQIYFALAQGRPANEPLLVRVRGSGRELAGLVQSEQRRLDSGLPAAKVSTMRVAIAERQGGERMYALIAGLFGGVALALAALGLYSVLVYDVAQRTREIGVRLALGAQTGDLLGLVVRQGLGVAAVGVALGLAANVGLLRLVASQFYGVGPFDPVAALAGAAIVAGVALGAAWLPARQATRVDPLVALRAE
jgi:predicted permease